MTRSQTAAPRIATLLAAVLLAGLPLTGCSVVGGSKEPPTVFAPEAKVALVARLLADPAAVRDIGVAEPTLDDLYAHFLHREAA